MTRGVDEANGPDSAGRRGAQAQNTCRHTNQEAQRAQDQASLVTQNDQTNASQLVVQQGTGEGQAMNTVPRLLIEDGTANRRDGTT